MKTLLLKYSTVAFGSRLDYAVLRVKVAMRDLLKKVCDISTHLINSFSCNRDTPCVSLKAHIKKFLSNRNTQRNSIEQGRRKDDSPQEKITVYLVQNLFNSRVNIRL